MAESACRDQAIDARADRETVAAGNSIELGGLLEDLATSCRCRRLGLRKTSIQREVSTSSTRPWPGLGVRRRVASHLGEISLSEARAGELEDSVRPMPAQEILQGPRHRLRGGLLTADADDLLEELLVEHQVGP